jgi:hypothetical protein
LISDSAVCHLFISSNRIASFTGCWNAQQEHRDQREHRDQIFNLELFFKIKDLTLPPSISK